MLSAVSTLSAGTAGATERDGELRETSGASKINMEVVGGGESAPNAGALPIDIPFAKTVGASPEPHAEPFLPSAHARAQAYATRTHARTHTHAIGHAVQTGSSNAGSSPRARTRRPCGLSMPRSPPLWRRSALIALASPKCFRPVSSRRR